MAQSMRPRRRSGAGAQPPTTVVDEVRLTAIVRADLLRLGAILAGLLVVMVGLGAVLR